jgi:methanogenic corrinoid protein MtbC1
VTRESNYNRFELVQKLLRVKQSAAEAMTEEFFRIHPEWVARFGARGRQFCTADACYHIEFLAGALQAGSPEAFGDYARWTARMLGARGIDAHSVEENLDQLGKHMAGLLLPSEQEEVMKFLSVGRQECGAQGPGREETGEEGLSLTMRAFLGAVLGGQRQAALTIIEEALRNGARHVDIYVDVITEALHRMGSLWEQNKISVAEEHMATAIAQYVVAMIYPRMIPPTPMRGKMVVTGVCGELHQIGSNMVADAMEAAGWDVRFLGSNLPERSVLETVEEFSPDTLCISTTLVSNLPAAAELIRSIRGRLGERTPRIILGGAAYGLSPRFVEENGPAETILDLRQALATI